VSPSLGCGLGNVFATFQDGSNLIVSNSAPVTVDGPASLGCPQSGGTHNLSVNVTGGANGVIASAPTGINCGTTCNAAFATGSSVALTATPNLGHTFVGWGLGCTSVIGATCNVTMNADVTVSATFN
jgi:Divergent InlB B-repeat domain